MDRINILLATYNGATFLREQLDTIEAQTHKNWRLIARDDDSTDTPVVIPQGSGVPGHGQSVVQKDAALPVVTSERS
jgi:GT2 family glycosyltransferase